MGFSAKIQNLTMVQGSGTNKSVFLSDGYDQGRHGLTVRWETPLVFLSLTVTRPTERFQRDASKLRQREVLTIKCTDIFCYSIH